VARAYRIVYFVSFEIMSRNIDITIDDHDHNESFVVAADKRHGKTGWRVLRYIQVPECGEEAYDWDEQYMFLETFPEILEMVDTRDFEPGRMAF
jgi:hypothetical protein